MQLCCAVHFTASPSSWCLELHTHLQLCLLHVALEWRWADGKICWCLQAHPPFRIYARSKPMPVINGQHPRNPVWTDISFPMSLDLIPETNQVMIGYGSGDQWSRVRMMPWQEVSDLFPHVAHGHQLIYTWRNNARKLQRMAESWLHS